MIAGGKQGAMDSGREDPCYAALARTLMYVHVSTQGKDTPRYM